MTVKVQPNTEEIVDAITNLHLLNEKDAFMEKAFSYSKDTIVFLMVKGLLLTLLELEFDVSSDEIWQIFEENSI